MPGRAPCSPADHPVDGWPLAAHDTTNRRKTCGDHLAQAANPAHNLRMESGDYPYIWQAADWPTWRFDLAALAGPMAEVSRAQGLLLGRLVDAGPAVVTRSGIADGRRFTHGYGDAHRDVLAPYWRGAIYEDAPLVIDGNLVTAQPSAHIDFGVEMVRQVCTIDAERARLLRTFYKGPAVK